ncbi:MAG: 3-phosphoshikimate 1-carboxyvinyltransferase [Halobacteriota archaeon]
MDVEVVPGTVAGRIRPPSSKSATHRALMLGALGGGGPVHRPLRSADTRATAGLIETLGAAVDLDGEPAVVRAPRGGRLRSAPGSIDCANSGTTLRLGLGLAATIDGRSVLTGDESLRRRPNAPLLEALDRLGARTAGTGDIGAAPVTVDGPIRGGRAAIDATASSQYLSSLLLAATGCPERVEIEATGPVASRPYLSLTLRALSIADVRVDEAEDRFVVPAGSTPRVPSTGFEIGIDPTAASYLLAAGALAGDPEVVVTGLDGGLRRPLSARDLLDAMGIDVEATRDALTAGRVTPMSATIDLGETPDLLPTAAVLAGVADGTSRLVNCPQARHKETDRIATTAALLRALDVPVTERPDGLVIEGRPDGFAGGTVESEGDHRIAMAGAIAGLAANAPVRIRDSAVVDVSYPAFFEALETLGADVRPAD